AAPTPPSAPRPGAAQPPRPATAPATAPGTAPRTAARHRADAARRTAPGHRADALPAPRRRRPNARDLAAAPAHAIRSPRHRSGNQPNGWPQPGASPLPTLSHARRPPIFAPLRADPGIKPPVSRAHDDRGEVRPLSRWSQSPAAERGTAHGGALPDPGGRGLRQDEDVGPPDRPPDPREGGAPSRIV